MIDSDHHCWVDDTTGLIFRCRAFSFSPISGRALAKYFLSYGPFTEEIFYHDFAAALFQCEEDTDYLKHLKEMVVYKNPFEYLKNFI